MLNDLHALLSLAVGMLITLTNYVSHTKSKTSFLITSGFSVLKLFLVASGRWALFQLPISLKAL